jgi:hypothetical protein
LYLKPHSTGESKRRKLEELEERNLILDNKRLEEEIERIKEERAVLEIRKEVLMLEKQKLVFDISTNYAHLLPPLNNEL